MALRNNFFTGAKTKNPWANVKFGVAQEPEPPSIRRATPDEYDYTNPSLEEYAAHVTRMPREEDYNPSIARRIIASIGGASEGYRGGALRGIQTAETINRQPYRRAIENWGLEGEGLETNARLQNNAITQRRLYQGLSDKDEYNTERNRISALDAATRQFNANTAKMRAEFESQSRNAKNEIDRERIKAQAQQWEKQNNLVQQRINNERSRTNAYSRSVDLQADRLSRPDTDTQLNARRRMGIDRVRNENPDWFDRAGNPLPEHAPKVEQEIQRYMQPRRYGNINLPAFDGGDDDWVVGPK